MPPTLSDLADRVARLEAAVDALVMAKTQQRERALRTRRAPRMPDAEMLELVSRWPKDGRNPIYQRLLAAGHVVSRERVRQAVAERDARRGRLKGGRPRVRQAHAA
jgi:type II secretory pathway pseudopilin PulG